MNPPATADAAEQYEPFYRHFDSPLMRRVRADAYGEDIGQHSWVGVDELRHDAERLGLHEGSRLLDVGCGPCGPLTHLLSVVGCTGVGLDLSASAIGIGQARAEQMGLARRFNARVADLNTPLPHDLEMFTAAMSIDVVLHLRDRFTLFREVARVLSPGGRFVFTDAGVLTGEITAVEARRRSVHGFTQFVPMGENESLVARAGFRVIDVEDRTPQVVRVAQGRLAAFARHRDALEALEGLASYERQVEYVTTVADLAARRVLSRVAYLVETNR